MEKIAKDNLQLEIEALLKDGFIANITKRNENLILEFVNGQRFQVIIQEQI